MFVVRFVSGGEVDPSAKRAARDEQFETRREVIATIRNKGYKSGLKVLENGVVVRLAYKQSTKK